MNTILCGLISLLFVHAGSAPDLADFAGNYAVSNNEVIAIAEWELDPSQPHVLAFTNLQTGRIGVLAETGNDTYSLREGLLSGSEVARIHFLRSEGRVTALTFEARGQPALRARRAQIRREQLTIAAGDTKLPATLFAPPGKKRFPVIVIVPAGAVGRTASATFPNFFLAEGFGVVVYDRRAGHDPFTTYADDAIAVVKSISRRDDVEARHIGLWGHSQGGWVSLIAASRSDAISFVIDHSGMLVPAWQQELYRLAAEAAADGVAPEQVSKAVEFEARLMGVAKSGQGWPELSESLRLSQRAEWIKLAYQPESLDELQRVWRDDFSFDPRPFAAGVHQPVLALFGGLDRSTPAESAGNLANAMMHSPRLTIEFFPTADHAFLEARTGGNAEIPGLSRFAPGMFESIHRWLSANAHTK